jgi:hypothetical protein
MIDMQARWLPSDTSVQNHTSAANWTQEQIQALLSTSSADAYYTTTIWTGHRLLVYLICSPFSTFAHNSYKTAPSILT